VGAGLSAESCCWGGAAEREEEDETRGKEEEFQAEAVGRVGDKKREDDTEKEEVVQYEI